MTKTRAFTLIELLIVVGIIAILAAIAVPNMLEAQIRAKVTRCKADLRTIATGLEMYRVDQNAYCTYHYIPNAKATSGFSFHAGGTVTSLGSSPVFTGPNPITSPVAYLTTFPTDVFNSHTGTEPEEGKQYYYVNWDYAITVINFPAFQDLQQVQGPWRIHSPGPDRGGPDTIAGGIQIAYDPTNGTVSMGDVVRTQRQGQI